MRTDSRKDKRDEDTERKEKGNTCFFHTFVLGYLLAAIAFCKAICCTARSEASSGAA